MFLLVPAHLGCPGENPESHKMVVCVSVSVCVCVCMCVCSRLCRCCCLYAGVLTGDVWLSEYDPLHIMLRAVYRREIQQSMDRYTELYALP